MEPTFTYHRAWFIVSAESAPATENLARLDRLRPDRSGRAYATKQVEAIAVPEDGWLVITVLVRFF
jgi:hypothetical protein